MCAQVQPNAAESQQSTGLQAEKHADKELKVTSVKVTELSGKMILMPVGPKLYFMCICPSILKH